MIARFGIDTSVLVRLATGDPEGGFEHCVRKFTALMEVEKTVLKFVHRLHAIRIKGEIFLMCATAETALHSSSRK